MLHFSLPTPDDQSWICPILSESNQMGADYTFSNLFFWRHYYGQVGLAEGCLTQYAFQHGKNVYLFPAGSGNLGSAVEALYHDAMERGGKFRIRGVTKETKVFLEEAFPGKFRFTSLRSAFDYLYTVEDLATLKGRKLQSKRNFCNRFEQTFQDWWTEPMTLQHIPACKVLAERWYETHPVSTEEERGQLMSERKALYMAFENFSRLSVLGLALYAEGQLVAFSMGERMRKTMVDVNFEKALPEIPGGYNMMNREFARMVQRELPEVHYLNREDDMGAEGLRKAKESYQPAILLEKYFADWEETR